MQELDDLQTVTQPEHVKTNRMAQAARRMRYPVPMCSYSYTLLECFLQAHKLKLPLHTINEHIELQVWMQCLWQNTSRSCCRDNAWRPFTRSRSWLKQYSTSHSFS